MALLPTVARARALALLTVPWLVTACPVDPSSSESSTGESSSSTSEGDESTTGPAVCDPRPPSTTDCCCFSTFEAGEGIAIDNACRVVMTCPPVEIQCPPDDPLCPNLDDLSEAGFTVSDEGALDCILTALRDGTEGSLRWNYTGSSTPGFAFYYRTIHILPDRRAITDVLQGADLSGEWSDVTERVLAPAEDFEACLQQADPREKTACLLNPTSGDALNVCTVGGYYDNLI